MQPGLIRRMQRLEERIAALQQHAEQAHVENASLLERLQQVCRAGYGYWVTHRARLAKGTGTTG